MNKLILTSTIGLSALLPIKAQDLLPEVIVTASRSSEGYSETPYTTDILTTDELLDRALRTVPEALQFTPGISVQKTTHGHGSPFIRGFTGRQNLFLVDGIRINNSTFRAGPVQYLNTIDSFGINQLEVVKSQGSVQYGSDALGGTINAITTSSGYLDEDQGFFQRGALLYRIDSNSESHVTRLQQTIGSGKQWGLTLGANWKDFGDIKSDFYGRMRGTGYTEQNFDAKLEFSPAENLYITLAHQYLNQDDVSALNHQ